MSYISDRDFLIEVAKGNVAGHSLMQKFGENPDVDTGTVPEDMWDYGGVWVAPTTSRVHALVSSSASDSSGGGGAETIIVEGLDASYIFQSETVAMNGTTPVNTVNSYTMIHRMYVEVDAANALNVGNITATAAVDGTVTAHIAAGNGQTLMAIYQIPAGKTGYLLKLYTMNKRAAAAVGNADMALLVKPEDTGPFVTKFVWGIMGAGTSHIDHDFKAIIGYPEKSVIKISAENVSANNMDVAAGFDLLLVDD